MNIRGERAHVGAVERTAGPEAANVR